MPIHAQDAAESLEPEGIGKAREQFRLPVVIEHALRDGGAKRRHPVGKPRRNTSAVQREVCRPRALHRSILLSFALEAHTSHSCRAATRNGLHAVSPPMPRSAQPKVPTAAPFVPVSRSLTMLGAAAQECRGCD